MQDVSYETLKRLCYEKKGAEVLSRLQGFDIQEKVPEEARWQYYELLAACLSQQGEMSQSAAFYKQAVCFPGNMTIDIQRRICSQYLMVLHYLPDLPDGEVYQAHLLYNRLFANTRHYDHAKHIVRSSEDRIRVGYLVPAAENHVIYRFLHPLLTKYNPARYEVVCYVQGIAALSDKRMEQFPVRWVGLGGLLPSQAAQRIYEDGIDIFFETDGHTNGGWGLRVAGYKPAPIQIEGIGWFDTTGLAAMDYFLGDVHCDPPMVDRLFCEHILRLPKSHLCYMPSRYLKEYPVRRKPHSGTIYGCFNNFNKITDRVLEVWHQIVERVPDGKLLLKNVLPDEQYVRRMYERACRAGFTARNFEARPRTDTYADDYMEIDIALDTFPYPGGGTTCDALYMGIPVISLYGMRHGSRFGYSILKNMGLADLAAADEQEYIRIAVALGKDRELLGLLSGNLRGMMEKSAVMDGEYYIRQVEAFYERIYSDWTEKARR